MPADHETLDPSDWQQLRVQGHRMLDDMINYLENIRDRPVWQPIPAEVRARFREPLPAAPSDLDAVHRVFLDNILPYTSGNAHPGFFGWVQGGGTPVGMLAEMLAAGLNADCGGRDQMPIEVERQITAWVAELLGFPQTSSGVFVTGTSLANFVALLVARTAALGAGARREGLGAAPLTAYASASAHVCVSESLDLCGLGTAALRLIPVDRQHRIDVAALERAIAADVAAGKRPFFIAGTAGTVDVGAIDDLSALADCAARHQAWFHVDGALGALGMLSPELAPRFAGIERADSVAFDFHKWGQVPYDAGFVVVRDGELHRSTFTSPAAYLRREARGLAGGSPWPCDFGPDLSRGFRALKTWFTIKVLGGDAIGRSIARSCALARHLEARVAREPLLELLAPVGLNIVCFRYQPVDDARSDRLNADLVVAVQESGLAAPSTTTVAGRLAVRAAIVNHRSSEADVDRLVDAVLDQARRLDPR